MTSAGGCIKGVNAQVQESADKAKEKWGIPFSTIADPMCSIVDEVRGKGLLDIYVDDKMASELAKMVKTGENDATGGLYVRGVIQPAILAVDSQFKVLYRWSSAPSWKNLGGAVGRPKAKDVWGVVQRSLKGDFSCVEGSDGAGLPAIMFPVVLLGFLYNGRFVTVKGYGLNEGGTRDGRGNSHPLANMAKGTSLLLAILAAGWYSGSRKVRACIAIFLTSYFSWVYYALGEKMNNAWKLTTPAKKKKL